MRCFYHIERDFATIPMNFLWFEYHQVRFISFGIWFLGLFLTDFTSIISTPGDDGWGDVLQYIKIISIIHIIFILLFLTYLVFRILTDSQVRLSDPAPTWKMVIQSMFDMSLHLDIASIIFAYYFIDHRKLGIIIPEVLIVLDAFLTLLLTPFKRWRAFVDIFGVLPTVILGHVSLYMDMNYIFVFIPISVVFLCPLIFTVIAIGAMRRVTPSLKNFIRKVDPSLLPNLMNIPLTHNQGGNREVDNPDHGGHTEAKVDTPPSIQEKATTGLETDYFDFKSIPSAVLATFFIHFGCFCQGAHTNTMIVMAHYFITLAAILINTRVVAFPAIILTNVSDPTVQFNSVWPELSFV
ncbi:hypothetical protein TRFO_13147 [Tritrichomonas foetus]|uniref:Uncharacterized protein n=1 Tax=Tritrichomonas foetus TaxID=1144522 RepID=A0A1J4L092_9EUKA|nr:hypothetical protein TRFO_13147 [Tritrichomonas foetus]|eukprot:OHT16552.1 hypothetical protein TRFO_13147 [Tritrichomonas foetus]